MRLPSCDSSLPSPTFFLTSHRTLLATWQAHFDGNPRVGPILNSILLHPSGRAFVTAGTDGRVCLWDIQTFSLFRSIKPLEHSVTAIAFHESKIVCGGKDGGGPNNACRLFAKTVLWDLSKLGLDPGAQENYIQLRGYVSRVHEILTNGRDLAIVYLKGDTGVIDFGRRNSYVMHLRSEIICSYCS